MNSQGARVGLIDVRETPLSLDEVHAAVADPAAGGICVFIGAVRDLDDGRAVEALDYSAHPRARERLAAVAERIAATSDVVAVAAVHRVGELAIGDLAVVCAVSAAHRVDAFAACRRLIDELKAEVPIWKHQTFSDGDVVWTGAPG